MRNIKILAIIPYEGLRDNMLKAAKSYENVSMQVVVGTMELGLKYAKEAEKADYDIIISRGGTAETIEEYISLPVVHIPVSVFDYVQIIEKAGKTDKPTAIIGYANVTEDAYHIKAVAKSNIDIFTIMDPKEIIPLLEKLKSDGYQLIVGDVVTVEYARILGKTGIMMESGLDSARKSLAEAVKIYGYLEKYKTHSKEETSEKDSLTGFVYDGSETFEEFENRVISSLMEKENGSLSKISKIVGISRSTLWRKVNKNKE